MQEMTVLTDAFVSSFDCFEALKADDHRWYFYILEYVNGMVKIGSTRNPKPQRKGGRIHEAYDNGAG